MPAAHRLFSNKKVSEEDAMTHFPYFFQLYLDPFLIISPVSTVPSTILYFYLLHIYRERERERERKRESEVVAAHDKKT